MEKFAVSIAYGKFGHVTFQTENLKYQLVEKTLGCDDGSRPWQYYY